MRVWLYAIVRDEAPLMPYFLRHYTTWVDRLIFYDGQSIDGTREMITECPKAELRDYPGTCGIVDDEFLSFANEQWKEARGHAEWVIWVDADEFIYHPNITEVLTRYLSEGVDVPLIDGYTMVSKEFPTTTGQIYDEIKTGFPDNVWSKPVIFRNYIRWTVGRHGLDLTQFNPRRSDKAEIKLLHYRALGSDYVAERHRRNWDRVPQRSRNLNHGTNCQPGHVGHHSAEWLDEKIRQGCPVVI